MKNIICLLSFTLLALSCTTEDNPEQVFRVIYENGPIDLKLERATYSDTAIDMIGVFGGDSLFIQFPRTNVNGLENEKDIVVGTYFVGASPFVNMRFYDASRGIYREPVNGECNVSDVGFYISFLFDMRFSQGDNMSGTVRNQRTEYPD